MAEELARQEMPDVAPEEAGVEEEGEVEEGHGEDMAPGVPTNLEDAGVPLETHEPESEAFHASAAEFPDASVDPSLARSPELAEPAREGDVTEEQMVEESLVGNISVEEEDGKEDEEHQHEADVADEVLDLHEDEKEEVAEESEAAEPDAS